jgi:hypothetical protein
LLQFLVETTYEGLECGQGETLIAKLQFSHCDGSIDVLDIEDAPDDRSWDSAGDRALTNSHFHDSFM